MKLSALLSISFVGLALAAPSDLEGKKCTVPPSDCHNGTVVSERPYEYQSYCGYHIKGIPGKDFKRSKSKQDSFHDCSELCDQQGDCCVANYRKCTGECTLQLIKSGYCVQQQYTYTPDKVFDAAINVVVRSSSAASTVPRATATQSSGPGPSGAARHQF